LGHVLIGKQGVNALNVCNLVAVVTELIRQAVESVVAVSRVNGEYLLVFVAERAAVVLPIGTDRPLVLQERVQVPEELIKKWSAIVVIGGGINELSLASEIVHVSHKHLAFMWSWRIQS
jgi:hypothetical protein